MTICTPKSHLAVALLATVLGLVWLTEYRASAEDRETFVSLILKDAAAEKTSYGILISCELTLDNATARELSVQTNFYSVFDGLIVTVTTPEGRVLAQRPYIYHQSPRFAARSIVLKEGVTKGSLVFPLHDFPGKVGDALKVRLVGTLLGSDYHSTLSSETLSVKVTAESP